MTCQGCVRAVTRAIETLPGVQSATVDLETGRATVRWAAAAASDPPAVIEAVRNAGFEAEPIAATADPGTPDGPGAAAREAWSPLSGWRFNVVVGGTVAALLMLGEWVGRLGMERWFQWLSFALALPVQALCGARFYRGAWNQLRVGQSNMDTLVALGSTTAFGYSAWALFAGWPGHLYFMEAAGILTLISLGHWLEARASARAADSLRALLDLSPPQARWLNATGVETAVPVARLVPGDRVLIKPGDRVPVDGRVVEGTSTIDESMLTGEGVPVDKGPGAVLYGGTANVHGRLVMQVTATGESTALAQIIAVVQRAQNSRASIQKLGDRLSSVFVPAVVVVAVATGLWWGLAPETARRVTLALMPWLWHVTLPGSPLAAAVAHAAAVLIVACPCAMGLATPVAILAGTNAAARRGILIRDAQALEKSGRITAVAFDKTGTLTEGRLSVAAVEDRRDPETQSPPIVALAGALASSSNHPLSGAVARHAAASGQTGTAPPVLDQWQEVPGRGVEAASAQGRLRLGSPAWLIECGVAAADPAQGFARQWMGRGATLVGLAQDDRLLAWFALTDTVRTGARAVVERLARRGLHAYLVTGDHTATAAAVAGRVGIPAANLCANVRPADKAALIARLQATGHRVAFVGDGLNDAPALEQADLGIAVARASDVAREAADLILLRTDLEAIPEALALAQATLRTIKQNLFWAFFYNAAAVPLAALGFLSPLLCAAAMGLSDLLVIGNALRLRRPNRYWGQP
jgi:Cu+-exporting ATPase